MSAHSEIVALIETAGPIAYGYSGNPRTEARHWIDYGFTPADVAAWHAAGVYDAEFAADDRDAGRIPTAETGDRVHVITEAGVEAGVYQHGMAGGSRPHVVHVGTSPDGRPLRAVFADRIYATRRAAQREWTRAQQLGWTKAMFA